VTDIQTLNQYIDQQFQAEIIPALVDYIRIPNKSPAFDPQWAEHGYMDQAVALLVDWARPHVDALPGASLEIIRLGARTPVILIEIPGQGAETVLLYGHLDKQPEMTGWAEGTGPWVPVIKDGKLYGRGGADDGYSLFSALTAIEGLSRQGIPFARCVILIEACEESGSYDLPAYVDHLSDRIGTPSLVIALDSGCGNYDQLWLTTSLRGMTGGTLRVQVLDEGVHSGDASGIVPSSFRILRQVLSRLEDENTGEIKPSELHAQIPPERIAQARVAAESLGHEVYSKFPFANGTKPVSDDLVQLVLNRTWRPQLAITGADGWPGLESAGNVLRPHTAVKVSLRLPPTLDPQKAGEFVADLFQRDPPYGAHVEFKLEKAGSGWNAPAISPWLDAAIDKASRQIFGQGPAMMGEGGTIPFMGMLGEKFPNAQFVITGVLGPQSNAHGPNEFLHLEVARKITASVALVLADHFNAFAVR
jgi:acetylornithine deacetylase/succinyl-diaminopimelate desuccinylase-like protein